MDLAGVLAAGDERGKVAAIVGLVQRFGQRRQLGVADEAHAPSHFFRTADLQALPVFDGADELRRLLTATRASMTQGYPERLLESGRWLAGRR